MRKEITDFWVKEGPRCTEVYSHLQMRSYYFGIRRYAARHNDKFILTGWVPAGRNRRFAAGWTRWTPSNIRWKPRSGIIVIPRRWSCATGALFRPFEYLVGMYGTPRYTEMDPTIFVGITYTVLFGLMFADLGQGLCVSLVGWLMWKLKRMISAGC